MKKELYQIYLSEFTARFCVWNVISQLLVHLIHLHIGNASTQLYLIGVSISLLYISTIFGGAIRDYFQNEKVVVMLGIMLIAFGSFFLHYQSILFYSGLSLVLLGAGMVTPNTPLLLSSLSNEKNTRAYTSLYAITNTGVISGSALGGLAQTYFSWKMVLLLNGIIFAVWMIGCFSNSWLAEWKKINKNKLCKCMMLVLAGILVTYFYLAFRVVSQILMLLCATSYILFLIKICLEDAETRKKVTQIVLLTIPAIIFFSGEFQVASILVDFAKHFVSLHVLGIKIPAGSILALESIFVVLGAYFISKSNRISQIMSAQNRILFGLFFGMLAFIVLYFSHYFSSHHLISIAWLVLSFFLLGMGDVFLMPPIMAYAANNAPIKYKGLLMSGVYFSISLSGYFSGLLGSVLSSHYVKANDNLSFYSHSFLIMILILGVSLLSILTLNITRPIYQKP